MRYWLRGKRGGLLAFLVIAALVVGGLGWVTFAALHVESEQQLAQAQHEEEKVRAERERELDGKVRLALSLLEGRVLPALIQEENRPYNHYFAVYASPLALVNDKGVWRQETVLEPSALLNAPPPDWMLLHFQTDEGGSWGSPQILSNEYTQRLAALGVEMAPEIAERRDARQKLLGELQSYLKPRDLLALIEQRSGQSQWHENTLVVGGNFKDMSSAGVNRSFKDAGQPMAPSQQQLGKANGNPAGSYDDRREQAQRVQNESQAPALQKVDANRVARNLPRNGEDWFGRDLARPGRGETITITRGPRVPLWITTADGHERLLLARLVHVGTQRICQGIVLDWPQLQKVLAEEVASLFPDARFLPLRDAEHADPERTMSALPVVMDHGFAAPDAAEIAVPALGWTPLRVGLGLAWAAALLALAAVGLGAWSLLELSERRIRFVSAVTHELRTPLTTLRLYLDMLTGGMVRDETQKAEYLETLHQETERLNRLIGNVLAFSRLEKQRPRLNRSAVHLCDLLAHLQTTWQGRCQAAHKELVVENLVVRGAVLETDVELLQQSVGNLIDNACKYSREAPDPRIWLRAQAGPDRLVLEVEDRGPGVPADERRAIFHPFHRGHGADETAGGVGLGLALTQRWVSLLGGKLTVQQPDAGAGACFRIELPGHSFAPAAST